MLLLLVSVLLWVATAFSHGHSGNTECANGLKFVCLENSSCPTWFITANSNDTCECGNDWEKVIDCDNGLQQSSVLPCCCVTYDEEECTSYLGGCFYNCFSTGARTIYAPMPRNISSLNEEMCGPWNREGQLCGNCKEGFGPAAYSYDLKCVECSGASYGWLKYSVAAFLPLTCFLFIVIVLRISATAASLSAFILVSQILTTSTSMRLIIAANTIETHAVFLYLIRMYATLYGIWNLDFFRALYPSFCLPSRTTLHILAMDYAIAFYPLLLIGICYVYIKLHDHNFRLVVWTWKPFHRCFVRFRRYWNVRTTIADGFATFLLLSYVKIASVTFDILLSTPLRTPEGEVITRVWYYDGSLEYFGEEHLPFGILAIAVAIIFVILPPVVLFLYPCKCLHTLCRKLRNHDHALYTFMEAFQGYYKDGTNGDCRYFAAVYLCVRVLVLLIYQATISTFYYQIIAVLLTGVAIIVIAVRPYKRNIHNCIDAILLLILAMWHISVSGTTLPASRRSRFLTTSAVLAFLLATLPLVYISALVIYTLGILVRKRWPKVKINTLRFQVRRQQSDLGLPDREVNWERYASLLKPNPAGGGNTSNSRETQV